MKRQFTLLILIALSLIATACSGPEQPAESAGENIDQAINKGKNAVEEVTDETAKKIEEGSENMNK